MEKPRPAKKRRKQQASHGHGQRLVVHVRDFLVQKRQHLRFELCHLLHVGGKRRNPAGLVLFKPDDTAVVDASGLQLARDGAENGVGRRVHNLVFRNSAERRRNAQLQQHNASDH